MKYPVLETYRQGISKMCQYRKNMENGGKRESFVELCGKMENASCETPPKKATLRGGMLGMGLVNWAAHRRENGGKWGGDGGE